MFLPKLLTTPRNGLGETQPRLASNPNFTNISIDILLVVRMLTTSFPDNNIDAWRKLEGRDIFSPALLLDFRICQPLHSDNLYTYHQKLPYL